MRIDLIIIGVLCALCYFYAPVWKAVIGISLLVIAYFGIEWLLDYERLGK